MKFAVLIKHDKQLLLPFISASNKRELESQKLITSLLFAPKNVFSYPVVGTTSKFKGALDCTSRNICFNLCLKLMGTQTSFFNLFNISAACSVWVTKLASSHGSMLCT